MIEVETLSEIVKLAHRCCDPKAWDFLIGGAESETTVARNRQSLDQIAFRPRVLRDVSEIDPSVEFLGRKQRLPVMLAPIGGLEHYHPESALPVAKAAGDFGITQFLSSVSGSTPEAVAATAGQPPIYQYYVHEGAAEALAELDRVSDLGFAGFCLTADTVHYGRRERNIFNNFLPAGLSFKTGGASQPELDWKLVEKIKAKSRIPVIVKGIATPEDAVLCVNLGVDVVYVSNHGGRQFDHGRGAIDNLAAIADAVGGQVEIIIDGGFSRGTDILKAIALGARAVCIGRLYVYGLAAGGEAGVGRVLEIIETEMLNAMALLGVAELAELDAGYLHAAEPVRPPGVASAFPLIEIPERFY